MEQLGLTGGESLGYLFHVHLFLSTTPLSSTHGNASRALFLGSTRQFRNVRFLRLVSLNDNQKEIYFTKEWYVEKKNVMPYVLFLMTIS
ncbi:hypothetical protein CEXT_536341 [Caerostris extrusa]|uniref:Uncharacterized protein n=1 Tax=Caerostris extrusa TaxID=172846 RepID=A0AAV4PQ39_CAEEX|nr:hypothetical protein CEXT_536341 [Caerostris extrusa]